MLAITGATGFVGRSLSKMLADSGRPFRRIGRVASDGIVGVGDLGPATPWDDALDGVETVVHLAARVHQIRERDADPLRLHRVANVEGTLHLARRARTRGVRRLVFVSSIKAMGERTELGRRFRPDDPNHPQDAYGVSKYEAEQGLLRLASETGLEVCIVRPPLVYGAEVGANFRALVSLVQRGAPFPLASIRNKRSLIAVENLVDLLIRCSDHPDAVGRIFLCRDEQEFSTPDLLRAIGAALKITVRLFPFPPRALEAAAGALGQSEKLRRLTESLQVDDALTRETLGWRPPLQAQEALDRAAPHWRAALR